VIEVPGQPLAERILRAAVAGDAPAQQLLLFGPAGSGKRRAALDAAWALMDPAGEHPRTAEALDLTEVEAVGQQILLRDLEAALAQIASRPTVMARRVMIVHGAERLREQEGAPRLLKTLEEPPPLSHIVLVSDSPADLLDTLRSRCLPVPFRAAGWRATAEAGGPFELAMRAIGVELALAALADGATSPGRLVRELQGRMEAAADANPSAELEALRVEAAALDGRRGGRTAAKRAEDQEKRERRRMVTDGWTLVLDSAAATAADALAVAVGAEAAPAKKKTRRGSRGGRNRKKKPAAATTAADGGETEAEGNTAADSDASEPAAPRIHVPDLELGDDTPKPARKRTPKPKPSAAEGDEEGAEQIAAAIAVAQDGDDAEPAPAKKKTRRGSRGGRNRKKPAAAGAAATGAAAAENGAEPAASAAEPQTSSNGGEPASDEYVPMSEWLDDLDA
jgi:DNA polymerase-3 subunit delta'